MSDKIKMSDKAIAAFVEIPARRALLKEMEAAGSNGWVQ